MRRVFTSRQKQILRLIAGNLCCICGQSLEFGFHADHIVPFSKGGPTIIRNGQALCPSCNLMKGSKID